MMRSYERFTDGLKEVVALVVDEAVIE